MGSVIDVQAPDAESILRRAGDAAAARGIYVHIPFCFHKCHYCDFYSIVDDRDRQGAFVERMIDESRALARIAPQRPETIFVGGGTPTLLRPELWGMLLDAWRGAFDLGALREFTVEANPETVTEELMTRLAENGVNRISLGAQSFNPAHLKTLERWHDPENVARSVRRARAAGIGNINLDLIFAIPGQSRDDWRADLDAALALGPDHLSCYALMFEPNTPLTKKREMGLIARADEGIEAMMFEATIETLAGAGYEHYEVSNFARPGRRCRHNLLYWLSENWLPVGPSAAGHVGGVRWKNTPHLGRYLDSHGTSPATDVEALDPQASIGERLMLRLRLIEGAENTWLDANLNPTRRDTLETLTAHALVERTPTHTRLTPRGLLLADAVLAELL